MKKIYLFFLLILVINKSFSQNIFFDDFSSFNLAKIDGQGGWSSATPSLGNGTGACTGVSCLPVLVTTKAITYPNFGSCTQAINPVDGALATGDGPGKSVGAAITSGSIYVALLVNFSTPSAGTQPTGSKQVVRFMDNNSNVATRIYIKQIASGGAFQLGIDKFSGSITSYSSSNYAYGQDHLIILKYKFNSSSTNDDECVAYIDPDLSLPEPAIPATKSIGGTDATTITRVAFPWNFSNFIPNGYIGMVSVAKDWKNIVPQTTYSIDGKTVSPLQKAIPNAKVKITTATTKDSTLSTSNGTYGFSNLSTDNYVLKPSKNNDISKANGVNSVDVLLVQRHILNTTKINNAYKLIAADVNGDKNINATDVLRMKRLILGTDTTFASPTKGNRLWEFIDSAYQFPDTTNPFPFKDSIVLNNLSSNQTNQTFIGVKLGDVNNDWNSNIARYATANSVNLSYNVSKNKSDIYTINILTNECNDIVALQYALHFDNNNFEFVDLKNNIAKQSCYLQKSKADIAVLFIQPNENGTSFYDGNVLLSFQLRAKNKTTATPIVTLNNNTLNAEAYDKNLLLHKVNLSNK